MWFSFPQGAESITVEHQTFSTELTYEGKRYFRAPDHFAPRILAIGGFAIVRDLPADAPEDLPKADPLRDNAIVELTNTTEALKVEVQNMRSDLVVANAKVVALVNERAELTRRLDEALSRVAQLEEDLKDGPSAPLQTPVLATVGGKPR